MVTVKRQVLVIDDEAAVRHMLRLALEREGYQVSEAENGRAGLALLQSSSPDFILCDIRMPELDGPGFLQEKERNRLGGTVIMMSAYGTIDTAVSCMQQGNSGPAILRLTDRITLPLEDQAQHVAHRRLVIDDQHLPLHGRHQ